MRASAVNTEYPEAVHYVSRMRVAGQVSGKRQ